MEPIFESDDTRDWTEKPSTPKQIHFLKERGVDASNMKRGEASHHISKLKREAALNPSSEIKQRIEALFNDGYLQTSRKFCHVARLPQGKTGIEALIEAELANVNLPPDHPSWDHWQKHYPEWAHGMGELSAAKQYRCCHAGRAGLSLVLDPDTFNALREYTQARGVDFSWGQLRESP